MRLLVLFCFALTLSACGGARTGEGYTSGVCKERVVKDYAEWARKCSVQSQRGLEGYRSCKKGARDFLEDYPGVSCEVSGSQYGGGQFGGGQYGSQLRIEHQTLEQYIQVMERMGA